MPAFKSLEEKADSGVMNRIPREVLLEISLRHIRLVLSTVNENAVPRTILGRTRPGNALVPFIATAEDRVDIVYHASVVEQQVVDHLADRELSLAALRSHDDQDCGLEACIARTIMPSRALLNGPGSSISEPSASMA